MNHQKRSIFACQIWVNKNFKLSHLDYLSQHIEALIFSAPKTIKFDEIREALQTAFDTKIKKADLQKSLDELVEKYKDDQFAFEIINIAEGYQFLTKSLYFTSIAEYIKLEAKRKLSKAALETLAIIAYKEPVPKSEAEKIRGVSCDYTVQKLLEKELIEIKGRSEGPGRPLLYGTSKKFLDYFGISGKKDLPQLKDFAAPDSEIGDPKGIEEVTDKEKNEGDSTEVATADGEVTVLEEGSVSEDATDKPTPSE